MRKLAITSFIVLICSFGALAQEATPTPSPSPDRVVVSKLTEDADMVELRPMPIQYLFNGKPSSQFHAIFNASFAKSVKVPSVSNVVTLWFHSSSPVCRYPSMGKFKVFVRADDESIEIGSDMRAANSGEVATTFSEPENGCVESLWAHIRKETFLKIANAQKVEIRFGSLAFQLGKSHIEALRDLASRM